MRDLDELTSWYADWSSLRVAVLGLGATGFAAADTLTELRCAVLVVAAEADEERIDLLSVIGARYSPQSDREVIPPDLASFDPELIVVSPGYAPDHPLVAWAREGGIPIWVAGGGEKVTLRIAAQYAQYTNFAGTPDEFEAKSALLKGHCDDLGTDYGAITRSANYNTVVGATEAEVQERIKAIIARVTPYIGADRA